MVSSQRAAGSRRRRNLHGCRRWPSTGAWSRPSRRRPRTTSPRACSTPSGPPWTRRAPQRTPSRASRTGRPWPRTPCSKARARAPSSWPPEGFEDLVELGRQARADLYRLCAAHPPPLVPPERRVGADERMGPDGVLRELGGARRADRTRAGARARGRRRVPAPRLPPPAARAGDWEMRFARPSPRSTSRSRTPPWGRSANMSERPRPRSTPRSRRCCPRICGGWSTGLKRRDCRGPT